MATRFPGLTPRAIREIALQWELVPEHERHEFLPVFTWCDNSRDPDGSDSDLSLGLMDKQDAPSEYIAESQGVRLARISIHRWSAVTRNA
jgi:hypothetical protein